MPEKNSFIMAIKIGTSIASSKVTTMETTTENIPVDDLRSGEFMILNPHKLRKARLLAQDSSLFNLLESREQHEVIMHIYNLL